MGWGDWLLLAVVLIGPMALMYIPPGPDGPA